VPEHEWKKPCGDEILFVKNIPAVLEARKSKKEAAEGQEENTCRGTRCD
jgi:hypothetical protein